MTSEMKSFIKKLGEKPAKTTQSLNGVVQAVCKKCGHKEQMFGFFWNGVNKCLDCGGEMRVVK